MYKFAQQLVRHKVGVVAVAAFAVFVFSGHKKEEVPTSPWARGAQTSASSSQIASADTSVTAKLGHMATVAGDYVAEKALGDKDLNPVKLGESTAQNFDKTVDAMSGANKN